MSKSTKGQWYYEEYIPEEVTLNGKEYLIQSESKEDIALVRTEADARLIARAPEMYGLLNKAHSILYRFTIEEAIDVVDLKTLVKESVELLNRIESKKTNK